MTECTYCKAETQLYDNGVPTCLKCFEVRRPKPPNRDHILTNLVGRIAKATAQVSAANQTFSDIISKFPTGLPHPDGVQRIKKASMELDVARKEMMKAHTRLNDFIERGIVPDDLKRSG
jgi:hypothetical protein